MDFEFTPEQLDFVKEVEEFLDANDDPEVFDVTRENMAQIVDTPLRRQFMAKVGEQGWLGITWPKEYGGKEGEGIYEYLLNEALAARGGPQIGKGVGIIGKTIISHGSEGLKQEFLPEDPPQRGRVRRGLLGAQRRLGRRLHAVEGHQGGRGVEPQRPEDLDHLGPLRRLVLGGGPHRPRCRQALRDHLVSGAR